MSLLINIVFVFKILKLEEAQAARQGNVGVFHAHSPALHGWGNPGKSLAVLNGYTSKQSQMHKSAFAAHSHTAHQHSELIKHDWRDPPKRWHLAVWARKGPHSKPLSEHFLVFGFSLAKLGFAKIKQNKRLGVG